jgi:hypothetical protein
MELKLKLNKKEEKLKSLEKSRNREKDKKEKELSDIIDNYELTIKNILNNKNNRDTEIHMKNEQLNILKTNNEKIISLHEKKFQFYENEIKVLKEKIEQLLNISKENENKLNSEIQQLKKINNDLKKEKNKYNNNDNNKSMNKSIAKLMNSINNHIKEQSDENKLILDNLMTDKEKEFQSDKEFIKKLSALKQKNKDLELKLKSTNYQIKSLEQKINESTQSIDLINNINNIQCKECKQYFTFEDYKIHKNNCNYNSEFNNNINPDKLRIRILKGKIKNEKNGKPYLEYIMDIYYSNIYHWRLGKKFSDFTKLYNTINTMYKEYITIPISNIFIDLNNSSNVGSFHENKLRQLEQFINDIIDTEIINVSKPFIKFIEFEKFYDEDSDLMTSINKSQNQQYNNSILKESNKNKQNNEYDDNLYSNNYYNYDDNHGNFEEKDNN